ncbi:MAG: intradiol ring-cleavage dioxygenase [Casimicrobiaceae bacterium]
MHDEELRAVRRITRRKTLALIGASGVALLAGARMSRAAGNGDTAGPVCIVRPAQTEGPFFVDGELQRSDIRADARDGSVKPGVPLRLRFQIAQGASAACNPLAGAQVHVWHSDAAGGYSDPGERRASSASQQFLRGFQLTDASGAAEFLTIYPGWYQGRAPHIHFKLRLTVAGAATRSREFTSQLYFDDALSDRIYAAAPYAERGRLAVRNADDFIYRGGGEQLLLTAARDGQGYAAVFAIGVQA